MTDANHRTKWTRARDLLFYCLIGVSLVILIILYGNYQIHAKEAPGLPVKWLGFAIMTGLVFLNGIRSYRGSWGQRRYWLLLAVFSILHFGVGFIVVLRLGKVGLVNFAIATIIEYFVLRAYLDHFLNRRH